VLPFRLTPSLDLSGDFTKDEYAERGSAPNRLRAAFLFTVFFCCPISLKSQSPPPPLSSPVRLGSHTRTHAHAHTHTHTHAHTHTHTHTHKGILLCLSLPVFEPNEARCIHDRNKANDIDADEPSEREREKEREERDRERDRLQTRLQDMLADALFPADLVAISPRRRRSRSRYEEEDLFTRNPRLIQQ